LVTCFFFFYSRVLPFFPFTPEFCQKDLRDARRDTVIGTNDSCRLASSHASTGGDGTAGQGLNRHSDPPASVSALTVNMGSGGLAVDAMAIGCLGVDRRGERFFVLSHFRKTLVFGGFFVTL
jgi:hypothetical protein